jgi:hypothetical protein
MSSLYFYIKILFDQKIVDIIYIYKVIVVKLKET